MELLNKNTKTIPYVQESEEWTWKVKEVDDILKTKIKLLEVENIISEVKKKYTRLDFWQTRHCRRKD